MCIGNSTKVPEKIAVQMGSAISLELSAIIDQSVEDILAIHKRDPEGTVALVLAQRKFIIEMAMEVEQLKERIRELEGQKSKDSHNSSKSSSTDTRRTSKGRRVKSGKPSGGQKGHPGHTLKMVDKPDKVVFHPVITCSHCGGSLEGIAAVDFELRQVFDLPPMNVEVTEHRAETKICPFCSSSKKATFPKEAQSPVQYGPWIKTIAVYWNQYQLLPYERLSESFLDLYGHAPSQATLIQATHECYEALESVEARIKELLHASHAMCVDETGMRIEGERKWCHVYGTNSETFYAPHNKRGAEAGNDIGILPGYKGTVVHDGLISYFKFDCKHALCNSHHIRDLTFVHEEYDQSWPQELVDLLLKIKNAVEIRKMEYAQYREGI